MIVSFLDIGSRTFRQATLKFKDKIEVLNSISEEVYLAKGIDTDGFINKDYLIKGFETLKRFKEISDSFGAVRYDVYSTHPLRVAKNREEFLNLAKGLDINIKILSEYEESRLSALGACYSLCKPNSVVIDIGGGSTEISFVRNYEPFYSLSIPIGSVTIDSLADDKLYNRLREPLFQISESMKFNDDTPICVGGSVNLIAMHHSCCVPYDPKKIRGCVLKYDDIKKFISLNNHETQLNTQTSNLKIATNGAKILLELMKVLNFFETIVSDAGLLHGIIINFIKKELNHARSYHTDCLYI